MSMVLQVQVGTRLQRNDNLATTNINDDQIYPPYMRYQVIAVKQGGYAGQEHRKWVILQEEAMPFYPRGIYMDEITDEWFIPD